MLTTGFIFALCIACLGLAWAWEVEKEKREDAERSYASMRSAAHVMGRERAEREDQLLTEMARLRGWLEHIRGASTDPLGDADKALNGLSAPDIVTRFRMRG